MLASSGANNWKSLRLDGSRVLPVGLSLVLSMSALGVLAQEEAVASQKAAPTVVETTEKPDAGVVETTEKPTAPVVEPGPEPLRNVELLNRLDDDRLPTRARRFLKLRFREVRQAKDEKILQLLLILVGFVGVFVAILALRSVPPPRSGS